MDAGTIGTVLFVGAAVALILVLIVMVTSKRVRSEVRTREGLFGRQPWWVRVLGVLFLVAFGLVVAQR